MNDLQFVISLGVPVENAAHRIGRTPTAVKQEIKALEKEQHL